MRIKSNKEMAKARKKLQKFEIVSPNLEDLIEVVVNDRTKIYFKKDASKKYIEEKVELYRKSLSSSLPIGHGDAHIIKNVSKTGGIDG